MIEAQVTQPGEQYDQVAEKYSLSFSLPQMRWRNLIEKHTVREWVGSVKGLMVLDAACGDGSYACLWYEEGARRVVGVDIAANMVAAARSRAAAAGFDITFLEGDITELDTQGPFDLCSAVYLLHYSPTREHLNAVCRAMARSLRDGGRLVTYQLNPDFALEPDYYRSYGLVVNHAPSYHDGQLFSFQLDLSADNDGTMLTPPLSLTYWSRDAINAALEDAGFRQIRWGRPTLSPQASADDVAYATAYLTIPHCVPLSASKSK